MDTVTNITTAASKAIFGEAGEEAAHNQTAGREPVSGQMGNVAAGEPYDKGNVETPRNKTPSTASGKNTNATSAEHGGAAANGTTGLYNPILPAGPGENGATDYTSSARRASGISANSRTGEQKSPTLRNAPESEKASGSAAVQKNGVTPEGKIGETRKTSDPSVTYATREGGRRKSRQSSGSRSVDRSELAFRSVSREAQRRASQRSALAPLHKTESARRRAANARVEDDVDGGAGVADSSVEKERKPSLKERIKARFQRH